MSNAMIQRRIKQILMQQAMGSGYGTHMGAMKGWKTRRKHMKGMGYGTHMGAIKGWATRKRHMRGRGDMANKMAAAHSPWIAFVKEYSHTNGIPYKEALIEAGPAYRQLTGRGGVLVGGRRRRHKRVGGAPVGGRRRRRSGSKTANRKRAYSLLSKLRRMM
jgi:uncharacterized protein YfiM (DUF2279 family)